jgi:hypothetical protein
MQLAAQSLLAAPARQLLMDAPADAYTRLTVPHESAGAVDLLSEMTPAALFDKPVKRADEARCVLAGLHLLLDQLDRSHRLSQEVGSASGSFWHAIMHRREGDFSNSKYWYARCAAHPVLPQLTAAGWSAAALVDLVQEVHDRPADPRYAEAVELQRLEWQILMNHCIRAAVGE